MRRRGGHCESIMVQVPGSVKLTLALLCLLRPGRRLVRQVVLWDRESGALVVPNHGADSPTIGRCDELGGNHATRLERNAFHRPGFFIGAEAMGDVAEDLR